MKFLFEEIRYSCSSDLVHIYANLKEYLHRPMTLAFLGVSLPRISFDVDLNLTETLKSMENVKKDFDQSIHLGLKFDFETKSSMIVLNFSASTRYLGHFSVDIETEKVNDDSSCVSLVELSPMTPWVFHVNRPFVFLIIHEENCFLIGQMLGPKYQSKR